MSESVDQTAQSVSGVGQAGTQFDINFKIVYDIIVCFESTVKCLAMHGISTQNIQYKTLKKISKNRIKLFELNSRKKNIYFWKNVVLVKSVKR